MTDEPTSARGRAPTTDEPALRATLRGPETHERRRAALGLVDLADDGELAAPTRVALRAATDDPDADVRQFAVEALGHAASDDADRGAIRAALGDDDEWVRAEAVVALSRTDPDPAALRGALSDDSGWVRRNAVVALGKTGTATADDLIDRIQEDAHAGVREFACQFLPAVDAEADRIERILAAVLARDPAAYVRAKAATALGDLGTDRAEAALEAQGLPDRSDDVRRAAKRALAAARGVDPEELDVDLPEDDHEPSPPGGGPETQPERGPRGPPTNGR